jgi:hypothetical protein
MILFFGLPFRKEDVIDTIEKQNHYNPTDWHFSYAHVPWIKAMDSAVLTTKTFQR